MYFVEVVFVYGRARVQNFFGPFATEQRRDEYMEILRRKEDECFNSAENHFDQDVRESAEMINPNHTKHLRHNGPLSGTGWEKMPTEDPNIFCWYKEKDMQDFAIASMGR